ncbi:hypothetical protein KEJ19_00675 [Candidatus Bathyarchaeota archaeon]|nr:hypothetical protein [Candidatus Bathyarchaeota archaeon]
MIGQRLRFRKGDLKNSLFLGVVRPLGHIEGITHGILYALEILQRDLAKETPQLPCTFGLN